MKTKKYYKYIKNKKLYNFKIEKVIKNLRELLFLVIRSFLRVYITFQFYFKI